jgi:hypothetical protein
VATAKPGLAFTFETAVGYAVGLVTYHKPRFGTLIWMARPTFPSPPSLDEARKIEQWRWPVGFPVNGALSQKIIEPIGVIEVPAALQPVPVMRARNPLDNNWNRLAISEYGRARFSGPTTDRSLPTYGTVNDTLLREWIESGHEPSETW